MSGILVAAAVTASLLLVAVLMALSSGGELAVYRADLVPAVGMLAAMGLWAVIGAGLGAIVRNQVAVVASGLIWILMLENLGAGLLEEAGRYLPGQAVHAMAQTREAIDLLATGTATILMAAYAALFVAAGLRGRKTTRHHVTTRGRRARARSNREGAPHPPLSNDMSPDPAVRTRP